MVAQHRKLLVAVAGLLVLVGRDYFGLELAEGDTLVDLVIAFLTGIGVQQVPNKQQ